MGVSTLISVFYKDAGSVNLRTPTSVLFSNLIQCKAVVCLGIFAYSWKIGVSNTYIFTKNHAEIKHTIYNYH